MADLSDLRAAVAAAITAAVPDAQCTGYVLSDPTPPFFDIELAQPAVEYDQSMSRGFDLWRLTVRCCVSYAADIAAQKRLDSFVKSSGASSVKQALEADQTLGGVAYTVHVTELSRYAPFQSRQTTSTYLGAEWTVEINTPG